MSAAAIPIYNMLIARGVSEKEARKSAEAAAAEAVEVAKTEVAGLNAEEAKAAAVEAAKAVAQAEAAKVAKTVAEAEAGKVVAHSEEKAKTTFVSKDEYHAHDKTLATRAEMHAGFAETNRRIDRLEERMDAGFAELRAAIAETNRRIDTLYRIGLVIAVAAVGTLAATVVAVVKFIFFGI